MKRSRTADAQLSDEKLVAWSKQPYGVGFNEVRQLAAELLQARRKLAKVENDASK
jgi:hypothetical protein